MLHRKKKFEKFKLIMGAELLVGAGLAAASTAASIASTSISNASQRGENAINREFNASEAEKQRAWSTNERLAAQQYNTGEREAAQRFQSESVGMNIANSVKALRASGVNANVLGSSAINSNASGSSGQSAPIGSAAPASFGTGINPQIFQIPQLMQGVSSLINASSKSKETKANIPLINQQLKYMIEQTYGQQKANELQDLYLKFEKSNLPTKIKKSLEEYAGMVIANGNAVKQGRVYEQQEKLLETQQRLNKELSKLHGEQAINAHFFNGHLNDIYRMDMDLKGAQVKSANAGAFLSTQQGKEISELLPDKKKGQIVSNALSQLNYDIMDLTKADTVDKAKSEASRLRNMAEHGEILGRYLAPNPKEHNRSIYDDFEDGLLDIWAKYRKGVELGRSGKK